MRCSDCFFLYNKLPGGRNPISCSEAGEQPHNEICASFRPRGTVPNLPLAPTEVQLSPDKPVDFEWAQAFRQIYGEQLQIERDLFETTESIQAELFHDQAPAQLDKGFERYVQKLADLRLLHVLCGLFECDVYRDVIMAAEIEKLFGVKPTPEAVASIQRATKELANARLLRVPNEPSGAAVGGPASRSAARRSRSKSVQAVDPAPRAAAKPRPA